MLCLPKKSKVAAPDKLDILLQGEMAANKEAQETTHLQVQQRTQVQLAWEEKRCKSLLAT